MNLGTFIHFGINIFLDFILFLYFFISLAINLYFKFMLESSTLDYCPELFKSTLKCMVEMAHHDSNALQKPARLFDILFCKIEFLKI